MWNSLQTLARAHDIEGTIDEVSDRNFHQPVNEKDTVDTIAGQSVEKEKKTSVILGDSIDKSIQGRKVGRKVAKL